MMDSVEIVKQLRKLADRAQVNFGGMASQQVEWLAADRIEQLQRELATSKQPGNGNTPTESEVMKAECGSIGDAGNGSPALPEELYVPDEHGPLVFTVVEAGDYEIVTTRHSVKAIRRISNPEAKNG